MTQQLRLDPSKSTILIVTDSATLHSGLGRVTREVFKPLYELDKWNIVQLGWFHADTGEKIPWQIIPTKVGEDGKPIPSDALGRETFEELIPIVKPDLVWSIADPWVLSYLGTSPQRSKYELIMYTCIDSEPIAQKYHNIFRTATLVVTFGKWPHRVLMESAGIDSEIIPHGVNIETYRRDPMARARIRPHITGGRDDKIVLGTVARNQPRKNLGMMFELMHHLYYGRYATCNECGRVTLYEINPCTREIRSQPKECKWCKSNDLKHAGVDDRWVWYYHGAVQDVGYDFNELKTRYALDPVLFLNAQLRPTLGMPDGDLNAVYNAMDISIMPTSCEGFGLPCHPAGTEVITGKGPVDIKNVKEGSWVVTHRGRSRRITGTTIREYNGSLVKLVLRGFPSGLRLTPEHKMFVAKKPVGPKGAKWNMARTEDDFHLCPRWIRAKSIEKGDYVAVPKMLRSRSRCRRDLMLRGSTTTKSILLTDYVNGVVESSGTVYFPMSYRTDAKTSLRTIADHFNCAIETVRRSVHGITTKSELNKDIKAYADSVGYSRPEHIRSKNKIDLSPEVMEFFGLYIAEGSVGAGGHSVGLDFHTNEDRLHALTMSVGRKLFGNARISKYTRGNRTSVIICSKIAAKLLSTLFGKGAHNKKIPPVLMRAVNTECLLRGYFFGDGCFTGQTITASTVSQILVGDVYRLMNQHGIYLERLRCIRKRTGGTEYTMRVPVQFHRRFKELTGIECKPQGTRRGRAVIEGKHHFFVPVSKVIVEGFTGKVYNLHVDEDESYLADGFPSHNCLESMATATPVVLPAYSAYMDWAPAGGLMVDIGARFIDYQINATRVMPSMEHMLECVLKLADPKVRKELGDAGIEKAKEYDWRTITPLWEKLFDSILSGPAPSSDWRRSISV